MTAIVRNRLYCWVAISTGLLAAVSALALTLPNGYTLVSIGDLLQTSLLLVLTVVTVRNMRVTHGHTRAFWGLMAAGAVCWLAATALWTVYEVIQRREVPIPFIGDVLFFLHVVPFMAAVGVRPHRSRTESGRKFALLDFALLMGWWVYLYLFFVIPWQYVTLDVPVYGFNFTLLYVIETSLLVALLLLASMRAPRGWRQIYLHLFGASLVYVLGSQMVNTAITRGVYYTGSLYDLPLNLSMCWYIYAALLGGELNPQPEPDRDRRLMPIWIARAAMLAVLSIPVIRVVSTMRPDTPEAVNGFRMYVTMIALLVLPSLVFLKQHLLDRELVRLLGVTEHNLDNLKRLQSQLVQAEKLTALGQLVGGAAHEINNPLTAILGYSDMVAQDSTVPEHARGFASKIAVQARRTRDIVDNLRKFAKQLPGKKSPVEINAIVENAIELRQLDAEAGIDFVRDLAPHRAHVVGDANQLLQVLFHVIGNAVDALRGVGGGVVVVRTWVDASAAWIEVCDSGPGVQDPRKIFDPFYSTKPVGRAAGLGLSVCYGIVNEHRGTISCQNRPEGGACFTISLPLAGPQDAPEETSLETVVLR